MDVIFHQLGSEKINLSGFLPNIAIHLNKQAMGNWCEDILWHRKPHSHFWDVASTDLSTRCISAWSNPSSLIQFRHCFSVWHFNLFIVVLFLTFMSSECLVICCSDGGVTSTVASKNGKNLMGGLWGTTGKPFCWSLLYCPPTNNRFVEITWHFFWLLFLDLRDYIRPY